MHFYFEWIFRLNAKFSSINCLTNLVSIFISIKMSNHGGTKTCMSSTRVMGTPGSWRSREEALLLPLPKPSSFFLNCRKYSPPWNCQCLFIFLRVQSSCLIFKVLHDLTSLPSFSCAHSHLVTWVFFWTFYLFSLFLGTLSLCCCMWAFSTGAGRGHSSLRCTGFSLPCLLL